MSGWLTRDPQVGEKVYLIEYNTFLVGTITKITPKAKQMTVDFNGQTRRYDCNGYAIGRFYNRWAQIQPYTAEAEEQFNREQKERKDRQECKHKLEEMYKKVNWLNYDDVLKLIDVLNEVADHQQ